MSCRALRIPIVSRPWACATNSKRAARVPKLAQSSGTVITELPHQFPDVRPRADKQ